MCTYINCVEFLGYGKLRGFLLVLFYLFGFYDVWHNVSKNAAMI